MGILLYNSTGIKLFNNRFLTIFVLIKLKPNPTSQTLHMKIAIGNDHAGTDYKNTITAYLESEGHKVTNYGTDSDESVDYPDFVHPVAAAVEAGNVDYGIIICGSGNGANMTANKHQKVRSALCWTKEITALAREHNDANVLSIPARFTSEPQALEMVKTFLNTDFEGGRHLRRVEKIACS
ncbi:ribose 5-phosphate isomerase B [Marinirhabdus gelatinilytica]|uniref:Ribose 5-phosphate isomerase B n=2 Tax=Marinirhabdus gelatinilytica TaxID=1703343 RepID=A0A370QJC5_9FLAO|nr:ribose 5-phosphate isomerase B [Marinirhabdus gelatinilytica]